MTSDRYVSLGQILKIGLIGKLSRSSCLQLMSDERLDHLLRPVG
jgi:hypothetical protein